MAEELSCSDDNDLLTLRNGRAVLLTGLVAGVFVAVVVAVLNYSLPAPGFRSLTWALIPAGWMALGTFAYYLALRAF